MTYEEALHYKENVTGHTTMIGKYEHVYLVIPSNQADFLKYTADYFSKYKEKTFFDETAKEYSSDGDYTVTNFIVVLHLP